MDEEQVGIVTHFYRRISVAVVQLSAPLAIGDTIHIVGRITNFLQPVSSMEIDYHKIESVDAGQEVAIQMDEYTRRGDTIFKVA